MRLQGRIMLSRVDGEACRVAAFKHGANLFLPKGAPAGLRGIQEWLSFYFKSPMCAPQLYPEHDLFIQLMKLKNMQRWMIGEELITDLGAEYYD